jgi:hypothetical protein
VLDGEALAALELDDHLPAFDSLKHAVQDVLARGGNRELDPRVMPCETREIIHPVE